MNSDILSIVALSVGLQPLAIRHLILSAPKRYKVFEIEKKRGGSRIIAQPARDTKLMQAAMLPRLRELLPVHECAYAYRKGRSIKDNAAAHASSAFLLKLDFQNFFPSITPDDLLSRIEKKDSLSIDDKRLISSLFFWMPRGATRMQLSIGAPSSPAISNIVMYEFDTALCAYCQNNLITYTRYADDLSFSTNEKNVLRDVIRFVESYFRENRSPSLTLNHAKTVNFSKRHKRTVTGLVLTPDGMISIGRDKKRLIHSLLNSYRHNDLSDEKVNLLRGLLAYVNSAERSFLKTLSRKYGQEVMSALLPNVELR